MKLIEYLEQDVPRKQCNVLLRKREFKIGDWINTNGYCKYAAVSIIGVIINDEFYATPKAELFKSYVIRVLGDSLDTRLYTMDDFGNPKTASCFTLNELDVPLNFKK